MVLWQYLGALIINSLIMFFLARYFAEKENKVKKLILKRLKKNINDFLDLYLEDREHSNDIDYHSISAEEYLSYKAQEIMGYRFYLVEKFLIKINMIYQKEITTVDEMDSTSTQKKITKKRIACFNTERTTEANIRGLQDDVRQGLFDGIILSVLQAS